jgi:hypothetical protein
MNLISLSVLGFLLGSSDGVIDAEDSLSCHLSLYITKPQHAMLLEGSALDSLAFEILDLMARERHTLRDSCVLPDSLAVLYGYRANVWSGVAALAALGRIMKWGNDSYTLQTLEQAVDRLREAEAVVSLAAPEEANDLQDFNENLYELYEAVRPMNGLGIESYPNWRRDARHESERHRFIQKALLLMLHKLPTNAPAISPEHTLFRWLLGKLRPVIK